MTRAWPLAVLLAAGCGEDADAGPADLVCAYSAEAPQGALFGSAGLHDPSSWLRCGPVEWSDPLPVSGYRLEVTDLVLSPCGETYAYRGDDGRAICVPRSTLTVWADDAGGRRPSCGAPYDVGEPALCPDGTEPSCRPAPVVGEGPDCDAWVQATCGDLFWDAAETPACTEGCGLVLAFETVGVASGLGCPGAYCDRRPDDPACL